MRNQRRIFHIVRLFAALGVLLGGWMFSKYIGSGAIQQNKYTQKPQIAASNQKQEKISALDCVAHLNRTLGLPVQAEEIKDARLCDTPLGDSILYKFQNPPEPLTSIVLYADASTIESNCYAVVFTFQRQPNDAQISKILSICGTGWAGNTDAIQLMTMSREWVSRENHVARSFLSTVTVVFDGKVQAEQAKRMDATKRSQLVPRL